MIALTVARVMTNAALFEHMAMSESMAMIFFTRATNHELAITFYPGFLGVTDVEVELAPSPPFGGL